MTLTLSPFTRKFLALALLIGVLALLWLVMAKPIEDKFKSYEEGIAHSERLLTRYRQASGERELLEARLEHSREVDSSRGGFLQGDNAELVAASLQSDVKAVIARGGGQLRSIQVLADTEETKFRKVAIRVSMSGSTEALRDILYDLETANPYLFIENIDVRARPSRRNELQVRFDVYGFIRIDES